MSDTSADEQALERKRLEREAYAESYQAHVRNTDKQALEREILERERYAESWQVHADASVLEFAPAVKHIADLMDELKSKAATFNPGNPECYEIKLGGVEKVCYFSTSWSGKSDLDLSLELLTQRLRAAFLPSPTVPSLMEGRVEPTVPGGGLFNTISAVLGFFNFVASTEDREGMNDRLADFCVDTFSGLHESATLSEGDWRQLREAATARVYWRLRARLFGGKNDPGRPSEELRFKANYHRFSYSRSYHQDDLRQGSASPLVVRIAHGEEKRLEAFLEALHGTLQGLSAATVFRKDIPPPADMIAFLHVLHSVLTGVGSVRTLSSVFPASGSVTVIDADPFPPDKKQLLIDDLQRQVQEAHQEVVETKALIEQQAQEAAEALRAANERTDELEEQLALLVPREMPGTVTDSFFSYLRRLDEAAGHARVKGARPAWNIQLDRDYIGTLTYSYDPSDVAYWLTQLHEKLEKVKSGGRRGVSPDILYSFSGVLGYYNLFLYLLQAPPNHRDSRLLPLLCNLSVSAWQVEALMSSLDAVSWLKEHLPPTSEVPNSPCSIRTSTNWSLYPNYRERAAEAVIELEKQALLDFRQSLYIAVSSLAPVLPEELDRQEQSFLTPSAQPQAWALPFSGPRVRIVNDDHPADLNLHHYEIELIEPRISQVVHIELDVDNEGKLLQPEEEGEE